MRSSSSRPACSSWCSVSWTRSSSTPRDRRRRGPSPRRRHAPASHPPSRPPPARSNHTGDEPPPPTLAHPRRDAVPKVDRGRELLCPPGHLGTQPGLEIIHGRPPESCAAPPAPGTTVTSRADRDAEHGGGLFLGQVLDDPQHHDDALLWRQAVQRRPQGVPVGNLGLEATVRPPIRQSCRPRRSSSRRRCRWYTHWRPSAGDTQTGRRPAPAATGATPGRRLGHHVLGLPGVTAQHEGEPGQRLAVKATAAERIIDHPRVSLRGSPQRSCLHHHRVTDIPTHRHLDDELAEHVPSHPVGASTGSAP